MAAPKNNRRSSQRLISPTTKVGEVLDSIMDRRGIPSGEIQRLCQIGTTCISRLRLGQRYLDFRTIRRLHVGLKLSKNELVDLFAAAYEDASRSA